MEKKQSNNKLIIIITVILLVVLVVGIIGVLAWGGNLYLNDKKQVDSSANNKTETTGSANENRVEEKYERVEVTEEPAVIKQEPEKNKPEEKEVEEVSISSEDKAIELAKKEYGSTEGVYFRIDQIQSSNVYIVSVRDENTTAALMWYTVDVKSGTVK